MVTVDVLCSMLLLSDPAGTAVEPAFDDPPAYEQRPKSTWKGSGYFTLGVSPMSVLHGEGFHPGVRHHIETGLAWARGRVRLYVGPDLHLSQIYGRKKPGFGIDAMMTVSLRHVYARIGAGTVARMPAYRDANETRPMMGGLVGGGLVGRLDHMEGRLGLDYDVRIDTTGRVAQTILVAMRLSFGP